MDEAQRLMAIYGPCPTCGAPRAVLTAEDENGTTTQRLVCTNDAEHDVHPA